MPLGAVIAAANVAGSALNSFSAQQTNAQQQRFNYDMYKIQRADALADWERNNAYNSPQAQMQRYQEAGLNPHLIYGQGSNGNASPMRSPDMQPVNFRDPRPGDALATLSQIYDLDIKAAQADNLKAQNTVIKQDALLRAAQIVSTQYGSERSKFDLDQLVSLKDVSADYKRTQLQKLKADLAYTTNQDARNAAANASSLREAAERMKNLQLQRAHTRADIDRINKVSRSIMGDIQLKELDYGLRRQGINPNDPMWARMLGIILTRLYDQYIDE